MIRADDSRAALAASVTPRQLRAQPGGLSRLLRHAAGCLGADHWPVSPPPRRSPPRPASKAAKPAKQRFSFETPLTPFQPPVTDASSFSFTAPGAMPRSAARLQSVERAFRFTPSGQTENRKALSLGVSTRVVAGTTDRSRAAPPAGNHRRAADVL